MTAIEPTEMRSGSNIVWKCTCECGGESFVSSNDLRRGHTTSCGCIKSKGEETITHILQENNILYQKEYSPQEIDKKRFDFFVENKYIIEFDGIQHFKFKGGWNTKENFEKTRASDLAKNKYCFDNNIPIIRIPHSVTPTIEDLKLETTKFLMTPIKENTYFEAYA